MPLMEHSSPGMRLVDLSGRVRFDRFDSGVLSGFPCHLLDETSSFLRLRKLELAMSALSLRLRLRPRSARTEQGRSRLLLRQTPWRASEPGLDREWYLARGELVLSAIAVAFSDSPRVETRSSWRGRLRTLDPGDSSVLV